MAEAVLEIDQMTYRAEEGGHLNRSSNARVSATMAERIDAFDWAATPLGPREQWPQSLRTAVQIVLGSRYPMFVWWGEAMVTLYNDGYAPMLGKRHPAALGRSGFDVWADIWPVVGPLARAVMHEGKSTWNEELLLIMERNGFAEESYFTFSYSPVLNDAGKPGGVFAAVTEDTARVLSRRRLRTLRELSAKALLAKTERDACRTAAEALSENAYDFPFALIYLLTEDGKSAELREAVGVAPGAAVAPDRIGVGEGSDVWNFDKVFSSRTAQLAGDLSEKFGALSAGPWSDATIQNALVLPLAKAGVQESPAGFLVAGLSPRLQFNDDYRGFLELAAGHIATAVANARAYEEERKRAEALAELDRAKTTFFSNISHEFRTPLTLMLGPLEETLANANGSLSAENRERLKSAHRNSLRLLKLVNTLLDFSRIEAGRIEACYEPVDLSEVTAELASVFRSAVETVGLGLTVECAALPEPVYVDRDMWEKIVLNLLSNAFKFTFEGAIGVSLRCCGDFVELSVKDTGVGIPADELPKIFDRFHRVRGARSRTHEGTGIGLSLVQELTRLHGGEVTVQSREGHGTCFTVRVRCGTAHLPAERINTVRKLERTAVGSQPFIEESLRWQPSLDFATEPVVDVTKADVLVVDDNSDMRDYLRSVLAPHFKVETVGDGEGALARIKKRRPDVVITDVMMPVMDGLGLLQRLRTDPVTSNLPVIVLSARAGDDARVEGIDAGADDYLTKPFSAQELIGRVHARMRAAKLRDEHAEQLRVAQRELEEHAATLEQTVAERTARLQESVGELEAFSYSIAHDMRAPLRAMEGYASFIAEECELDDNGQVYLDRIRASARRLDNLIVDVLNYSRVVRSDIPLSRVDSAALLKEIIHSYPNLHGAGVRIEIAQNLPVVQANSSALTQVFSNLLGNAVKFVAAGVNPEVQIWAEPAVENPCAVRFWFEDNGIGIPEDSLDSVFQMFQRVNGPMAYEGTGIGLAIVRKAMERMGGRVGVESRQGKGSRFWVELLRAQD